MRGMASAAVVAMLATAVYAHHSYPDFLLDQTATVEGTIESIQFENPHVLLKIRTADSIVYTAEWEAARSLKTTAVTSSTLRVGDHIVVIGCPPRDPALHELVALKQLRRPMDGWVWSPHWLLNR
jgi:hypothetical protein